MNPTIPQYKKELQQKLDRDTEAYYAAGGKKTDLPPAGEGTDRRVEAREEWR